MKNNGYKYSSTTSISSGKNMRKMAVFSNKAKLNANLKKILVIISPDYYYNTLRKCLQYSSFLLKYWYENKKVTL